MKQEIYQRQVIKKLSQLNQRSNKFKANETTSSSTVLSWTASTDEAVTGYNITMRC
jgi:hypothetical protein